MAGGTTLYLRALPRSLVREAKATAARRGITLTAFVAETLGQAVRWSPPAEPWRASAEVQAAPEELAESLRWFETHRPRLLRRYRDQYVAIHRDRVIDHDPDFDALARRVFAKLGTRPVCMPRVTAEERVVHLPSPRLAGE